MVTEREVLVKNAVACTQRRFSPQCLFAREFGLFTLILLLTSLRVAFGHSPTLHAASTVAPTPKNSFLVHSYLANGRQELPSAQDLHGKCLDYATGYKEAAGARHTVFLNDCAHSHPIVVEELNSGRHEVILHAGKQIIGIRRASVNGLPYRVALSTTENTLELFTPSLILPGSVDSTFALDGDSMILASSRCRGAPFST